MDAIKDSSCTQDFKIKTLDVRAVHVLQQEMRRSISTYNVHINGNPFKKPQLGDIQHNVERIWLGFQASWRRRCKMPHLGLNF